jgi:hypothetical protein
MKLASLMGLLIFGILAVALPQKPNITVQPPLPLVKTIVSKDMNRIVAQIDLWTQNGVYKVHTIACQSVAIAHEEYSSSGYHSGYHKEIKGDILLVLIRK